MGVRLTRKRTKEALWPLLTCMVEVSLSSHHLGMERCWLWAKLCNTPNLYAKVLNPSTSKWFYLEMGPLKR